MCSRYYIDPNMMEEISRWEDPAETRRYPSDRCRTGHWTVRTWTGTGYVQMGISPVKRQKSGHQCKGGNCHG